MNNLLNRARGEAGQMLGGIIAVVAVVFTVIVLFAFAFGWPFEKTNAGEIALSYGGGPFEGAQYQKTVEPGSGIVGNGFFDKWYKYPATQRNYRASAQDTEDRDTGPIACATKDNVSIGWEFVVNFFLNTNDVRTFHERIGIKYKAYTDDGWDRMLAQTAKPPLTRSLCDATRRYTAVDLYSAPEVLREVENAVGSGLKDTINEAFKADYFCGPGFKLGVDDCPEFTMTLEKPNLPEELVAQFNANAAAQEKIKQTESEARQREAQARGELAAQKASQQALTPEYLRYLEIKACEKAPNCVLVTGTSNQGVNVNVGQGG